MNMGENNARGVIRLVSINKAYFLSKFQSYKISVLRGPTFAASLLPNQRGSGPFINHPRHVYTCSTSPCTYRPNVIEFDIRTFIANLVDKLHGWPGSVPIRRNPNSNPLP